MPVIVHAGIGVSPGEIANDHLQPGSHYETEIIISQSDPYEAMQINIEVDAGDATSWFSFDPASQFIIEAGVQRYPLHVIVDVPSDAEYDTFSGAIRVKASPLAQGENAGGVAVVKGARLEVALVTTELSITDFIVRSLKLNSPRQNEDLVLEIWLENTGNTNTTPTKATIDIRNLNQELVRSVAATSFSGEVLPGETGTMTVSFQPGQLDVSEYFADVKVYLDERVLREDTLVFAVTKGDTEEILEGTSFLQQLLSNKPVLTFVLMSVSAVVLFLMLLVIKKRREDTGNNNNGKLYVIFCVLFLLVTVGIFFIVNFSALTSSATTSEVKGISYPENVSTPVVRGDSSEPTLFDKYGGYPIFSTPDLGSEVLYIAKQGEKFEVLGTEGDWYRIQYESEKGIITIGYLHNTSILQVGE